MSNTLQRIVAQIKFSNPGAASRGSLLTKDVLSRIVPLAQLFDALAGFTEEPAPLRDRLEWLGHAVIHLLGDDAQTLRLSVDVLEEPSEPSAAAIVWVAYEMLANAIRHGLHLRLIGRIEISVRADAGRFIVLEVKDDGWGPGNERSGEEYEIMTGLADFYRAKITLKRSAEWTTARMSISRSNSVIACGTPKVPARSI